ESFSQSSSYSPAAYIAQADKCKTLTTSLDGDQQQANQALAAAVGSVNDALVGFSDDVAAIAQSGATVSELLQTAQQKRAQAQLESALSESTLTTSTGLFRMYQSSDVQRAQSLLNGARLYALAARRAIEARYVVNLSTMTDPEPFVAAPSIWADSIYTYDL